MTIADTSVETIGSIFFRQFRELSLSKTRQKKTYTNELSAILDAYAPESSRMLRKRLEVYR